MNSTMLGANLFQPKPNVKNTFTIFWGVFGGSLGNDKFDNNANQNTDGVGQFR
jgi:hypothetical protein